MQRNLENYLSETRVSCIPDKLQNKSLASGKEGPALTQSGQSYDPVHLAKKGRQKEKYPIKDMKKMEGVMLDSSPHLSH